MRIVYAGTLPPHPGGSAVLGGDLLAGLARRGHAITAVAPITVEHAGADPLAAAPFTVIRYPVATFATALDRPPDEDDRARERAAVAEPLRALLAAGGVDLVIAGRELYALHVPALAHRFAVPCVVLAHGGPIWGMVHGTYPEALARAVLDGLASADRVIAVAAHLAARLRGFGIERVETVRNAVDVAAFRPGPRDPARRRALDLPPTALVIAHVSNLKSLKRPEDVAHAAIDALRADERLYLLLVGDGPGRAPIEAACARAGVAARLRCTGWVPRGAVPDLLRLADVVFMPSAVEALALVYLETQASGRVLVASDVAGAREVVADGETGLLFPMGDVPAATACLLRAAADPALRAAIGARARAYAETYTLDHALQSYERIFEAVRGCHG